MRAETGAQQRKGTAVGADASARAHFAARIEAEPLAVRMLLYALLNRFSRVLTRRDAGNVELVLAEVLNNITEHAYANTVGGAIEVAACHQPGRLCCTFRDWGAEVPDAVLSQPPGLLPEPEDLPEGGWGWSLIMSLAEGLQYRREGGTNELYLEIPVKRA